MATKPEGASQLTTLEYLGIVRHAQAWYPGMADKDKDGQEAQLTKRGVSDMQAVASRFREYLDEAELEPDQVVVFDVKTDQSEATARVFRAAAELPGVDQANLECLTPQKLPAATATKVKVEKQWGDAEDQLNGSGTKAAIIVGHDPQMSWLAHHLLPPKTLPFSLRPGELIWLELDETTNGAAAAKELEWVFSPSDASTTDQLLAKIKSKMDASKQLGAFCAALLTFSAKELAGGNKSDFYTATAGVGLTLLALGVVLFFVTLFRYDGLLMPKRFWGAAAPHERTRGVVHRPPGPDTWVLYQNMILVWNRAFMPAVAAAAAGIVAIVVALAEPTGKYELTVLLAIGTVVLIAALAWKRSTPALGVND